MDVRSGGENIRRKTGPSEIRTAGKAKGPRTHVGAPVGASGWAGAIVRHGPVVVIHARHGALRLTNPNFSTSSKPDCQTGLWTSSSVQQLCRLIKELPQTEKRRYHVGRSESRTGRPRVSITS